MNTTIAPKFVWKEGDFHEIPDAGTKGGPGSGDHGHAGRPGEVGGSGSGTVTAGDTSLIIPQGGEMAEKQKALMDYLKMMSAHPMSSEAYILKHGKFMEGIPLPKGVGRGEMKQCFSNATNVLLNQRMTDGKHSGWSYGEGYAFDGLIPVLHGWVVDDNGKVIDPTWPNPDKTVYFGVAYPREEYMAHIVRTKFYGVLGGSWQGRAAIIEAGGIPRG